MSLAGCSSFLQSALYQTLPSSTCCCSLPLFPPPRKVARKKRESTIASFWNDGSSADACYPFHRRAVLLVAVSVLPFKHLREAAAGQLQKVSEKMATGIQESQATELMKESKIDFWNSTLLAHEIGAQGVGETYLEIKGQGPRAAEKDFETQLSKMNKPEIPYLLGEAQETTGGSSFISFLYGIGIIVGSGVLGALFTASQREKNALESTIDSMKTQIKSQEMTTALLRESYEARLLNEQEEHQRKLRRFKNEEESLTSELNSAKDAVTSLGQELQNKRRLAEDLDDQRWQLENSFKEAREDKKLLETAFHENMDRVTALQDKIDLLALEINEKGGNVKNLKSLLAESESECENLSCTLQQAKADLAAASSSMEQLNEDIFKAIEESNSKGSIIDGLNVKIKSLTEEKDDSNRKFSDLMKSYNDMIFNLEKTAACNSEQLSKTNEQPQQLEEILKHTLSEVSCRQTIISELTRERDDMCALLEKERNEMHILKDELLSARELFATSKAEVSHTSKELMEAKSAYREVMSRILEMQGEYDQAKQLLSSNLKEAKATSKILSDELESAKVVLRSTEGELVSAASELKTVIEEREGLKRELVDTFSMVETTTNLLKEERKIVADLNEELQVLRDQILKDSELRRNLEADLDEATSSLNEMNMSSLLLSRELENTNSRNSSLETEKVILYNSLDEQKNKIKEAHENIEDAKNFITRLGSEKEKLEKRSKRFEKELAAAKGEILRLRRKIGVGQESLTVFHSKTNISNEMPAGTPFSVKRNASKSKKASTSF